jgi:hypothetical protein
VRSCVGEYSSAHRCCRRICPCNCPLLLHGAALGCRYVLHLLPARRSHTQTAIARSLPQRQRVACRLSCLTTRATRWPRLRLRCAFRASRSDGPMYLPCAKRRSIIIMPLRTLLASPPPSCCIPHGHLPSRMRVPAASAYAQIEAPLGRMQTRTRVPQTGEICRPGGRCRSSSSYTRRASSVTASRRVRAQLHTQYPSDPQRLA